MTDRRRTRRKAEKPRRENTTAHARAPVPRDERGQWLPGGASPNPGGRALAEREVRELARQHGAAAITKLRELMDGAEDERVQLLAAEALLSRGFGRPPAVLEHAGGPLVSINIPGNGGPITAEQAQAVYADIMSGKLEVPVIDITPAPSPALPPPHPRQEPRSLIGTPSLPAEPIEAPAPAPEPLREASPAAPQSSATIEPDPRTEPCPSTVGDLYAALAAPALRDPYAETRAREVAASQRREEHARQLEERNARDRAARIERERRAGDSGEEV